MTMMGYEKLAGADLFRMKDYVSRKRLTQMALDCFIAQKHCEFLDIVMMRVREQYPSVDWSHVAYHVELLSGNEDDCAETVLLKSCDDIGPRTPTPTMGPMSVSIYNKNLEEYDDMDLYA